MPIKEHSKNIQKNLQNLELVEIMQNGSDADKESAFNELYNSYAPKMRFFLLKLLNTIHSMSLEEMAATADDMTQEVFIKIFKKINSYKSSESLFTTFLHTVARNTFIDWTRNKATTFPEATFAYLGAVNSQINPDSEDISQTLLDDSASSSAETMNNEIRKVVFLALTKSGCNRKERDMFILICVQHKKYDEVVQERGMKMGAVKGTLHRAKEKLKSYIMKHHPEFAMTI